MQREYPEQPVVGVAAVVFSGSSVLMVKRDQAPARGQWSLPGGVVELGETLVEALERELREETSLTVETGGLIGVFDRIFRDRKNRIHYHYVLLDYWCRIVSGEPKAGSDISEVKLVPLKDMEGFEVGAEIKDTIGRADVLRRQHVVVKT